MNALIALVIVITLLSLHNCNVLAQNCVTLDGWDGGFSRFEWRMTGDVLEGFVVYNKKNLDQGWVALGISDFQGWGMTNADIVIAWKENGDYKYSMRHAEGLGLPPKAPGPNFEEHRIEITEDRVVFHFRKRISYPNVSNSVQIKDSTMSILAASNERQEDVTDDNFAIHTWKTKRYLNFISPATSECSVSQDKSPEPIETENNTQPSESPVSPSETESVPISSSSRHLVVSDQTTSGLPDRLETVEERSNSPPTFFISLSNLLLVVALHILLLHK